MDTPLRFGTQIPNWKFYKILKKRTPPRAMGPISVCVAPPGHRPISVYALFDLFEALFFITWCRGGHADRYWTHSPWWCPFFQNFIKFSIWYLGTKSQGGVQNFIEHFSHQLVLGTKLVENSKEAILFSLF